jgi:hypothetical protein
VYTVDVSGCGKRTALVAFEDLVEDVVETGRGRLVLEVTDQSRLVAVVDRLHEMGIVIERIEHLQRRAG